MKNNLVLTKDYPIVYNMKEIRKEYAGLDNFKGNIYIHVENREDHTSIWNIDGEEHVLDNYDSMFGFPFYLRQIYRRFYNEK